MKCLLKAGTCQVRFDHMPPHPYLHIHQFHLIDIQPVSQPKPIIYHLDISKASFHCLIPLTSWPTLRLSPASVPRLRPISLSSPSTLAIWFLFKANSNKSWPSLSQHTTNHTYSFNSSPESLSSRRIVSSKVDASTHWPSLVKLTLVTGWPIQSTRSWPMRIS